MGGRLRLFPDLRLIQFVHWIWISRSAAEFIKLELLGRGLF